MFIHQLLLYIHFNHIMHMVQSWHTYICPINCILSEIMLHIQNFVIAKLLLCWCPNTVKYSMTIPSLAWLDHIFYKELLLAVHGRLYYKQLSNNKLINFTEVANGNMLRTRFVLPVPLAAPGWFWSDGREWLPIRLKKLNIQQFQLKEKQQILSDEWQVVGPSENCGG